MFLDLHCSDSWSNSHHLSSARRRRCRENNLHHFPQNIGDCGFMVFCRCWVEVMILEGVRVGWALLPAWVVLVSLFLLPSHPSAAILMPGV